MSDIVERLRSLASHDDLWRKEHIEAATEIEALRRENQELRERCARFRTDRLYIVGHNDGWEAGVEECAKLIEPSNPESDWTEYARIKAECAAMIRTFSSGGVER